MAAKSVHPEPLSVSYIWTELEFCCPLPFPTLPPVTIILDPMLTTQGELRAVLRAVPAFHTEVAWLRRKTNELKYK